MYSKKLNDAIFGLVVGDALGVPYEFMTKKEIEKGGEIDMISGGTWDQPIGSWSDDSSLTLCLLDSLSSGYDLRDIAQKFIDWKTHHIWNANGYIFDIGITTSNAINTLMMIFREGDFESLEYLHYEAPINSNGNGGLMRILPLLWYIRGMDRDMQFHHIRQVGALTHPHIISIISCFIYLKFAEYLLDGYDKNGAYENTQKDMTNFIQNLDIDDEFMREFDDIIFKDIRNLITNQLDSTGYVVDSLKVSLYNFLKYDTYEDILKNTIKLGGDTDTAGAIVGGLAGLYYGIDSIPDRWLNVIKRRDEIQSLSDRFV